MRLKIQTPSSVKVYVISLMQAAEIPPFDPTQKAAVMKINYVQSGGEKSIDIQCM